MGFRTNLLKFDKNNCPENFTFILANKSLTHLGQLNNVETSSVHYVGNLNGADEISLKVYKSINGEVEPLWDNIVDFKTLYVAEVGEYFEITVSLDDEKNGYKTLTCTSLCEAELSNLNLYDIEINTEADIDRADYVITAFYNEKNPKASLLHRILKDKAPHYTIKYIDNSLKKLQRSFSINSTSIYEFLIGECAEQFNCMFVFNSSDRSISIYDLYTVCNDCGYRGAYSDVCPECGSDFLNYFGNDTAIYIDKENFAENIKFEVDAGSVKNCFRLVAGDDIMTATIRSLNQNGSNYIFYFTDEMKQDMSEELVEKLYAYDVLYDSYTEEYEQLLTDYYKAVDDELYYTSTMMPEAPSDDEDTDNEISIANQEIEKLTVDNLSPIGLTSVTTTTSIATVNSAIKNYAKVFVNSGLVKVDTLDSTFVYKGKNGNGDNYGEWTGKIQLTNYSDEEDIATTTTLTLTVHDNYPDFVEQKVLKNIANDDEDHSIYDVIKIEDINEFKEALTYYSLNRLESFKTAIESAIDVLIEVNEGSEDAELYNVFYTPYIDKLVACENEMDARQATINEIITRKENLLDNMVSIQSTLNFETFLGDLYKEFCTYRREDEYNNSNYISDGLNNAELIENARNFIEAAKKELYKSATKQNTITADLYNLLAMPEFKPLVENFALGNFIRVNVDDTIYRLRLINFEINFSDLTKLPVQFSDVTITKNGLNDVKSILDSAKNVGQNFAYVSKQAEKGQIANSTFEQMYQNGLNSALYRIKNNDNEEVIIDKGGILGRSFDDIENDYSQEQVRITHNLICFTENNWRSVEQAIGKHNYYKFDDDGICRQYTGYGVSAKFLTAPFINSAQIIGGDIYSTNYKIDSNGNVIEGAHIALIDGHFAFADGNLTYDKTKGLYVNGNGTFTGTIHAKKGGTIGGWNIGDTTITGGNTTLNSNGSISGGSTYKWSIGTDGAASFNKLTANGANINGTVTTGELTATGGKIANFVISNGHLYNGIAIGKSKSCGISCGTSLKGNDDYIFWAGNTNFRVDINGNLFSNSATITGGSLTIGSTFSVTNQGVLSATGANISGTLTAGDGSRLGSGSYIGSNKTTGWKITNNQIHTVKTISDGSPIMSFNAGDTADNIFIIAPDCFQIGGKFIYGDVPSGEIIGANFTKKVYISGGLKVTNGDCVIGGNCSITGSATAFNLNVTGGTIGNWKIINDSEGAGYLNGYNGTKKAISLYPAGMEYKGKTFYLLIYDEYTGAPKGGLTSSGWKDA